MRARRPFGSEVASSSAMAGCAIHKRLFAMEGPFKFHYCSIVGSLPFAEKSSSKENWSLRLREHWAGHAIEVWGERGSPVAVASRGAMHFTAVHRPPPVTRRPTPEIRNEKEECSYPSLGSRPDKTSPLLIRLRCLRKSYNQQRF